MLYCLPIYSNNYQSSYFSTSLLLYLATYLPLYLAIKTLDTKNKFGNNRSASIIRNRIICLAIKLQFVIVHLYYNVTTWKH